MYNHSSDRKTVPYSTVVVPAFLVATVLQTMHRYRRIQHGFQQPHVDVRCCWRPLAEAVLAGRPIYIRPAVDNKPPLFELLNVGVAATGHYLLVFLLLVGLANAATAVLLWRVCAQRGAPQIGLLAGILFVTSVPAAGGTVVNVRSFAMVGVLLSLSFTNPAARGVSVAVAGLFSQHAVFAVPVIAYDRLRDLNRARGVRWLATFVCSGLSVVVAAFGLVYAVWGEPSFNGALYWTFGAAEKYATNQTVPSLVGETDQWARSLAHEARKHLLLVVPATVVAQLALTERGSVRPIRETNAPVVTATLLALSMTVPLFVRAYRAYWLYPLPFLALLASVGYERLVTYGGRWVRRRFPPASEPTDAPTTSDDAADPSTEVSRPD